MPPTTRSKRKRQLAELERELVACCGGDAWRVNFARVRELVEIERVSVNCADDTGVTPLMHAARRGVTTPIARFLLENDANVDIVCHKGNTSLAYAVMEDNVAPAELLLEHGADVETRVHTEGTVDSVLMRAIMYRNVGMVRLLLRFGANTEWTLCDYAYYSALCIICRLDHFDDEWRESSIEIMRLLLDHDNGATINSFGPRDGELPPRSPLCEVGCTDNLEAAHLLIQHGAQVVYDGVYPDVPCPLIHAVEYGPLELVQLLLDNSRFSTSTNRGNPDRQVLPVNGGGNHPLSPPLDAALRLDSFQSEHKLEAAQLLVDRGANVNDRPFLWECARDGLHESALFLLRNGVNVNLADSDSGQTPLWIAAKKGNFELVKELIKAKANVAIRDNNSRETPLEVARRSGHKGIAYLLLRSSPHVWPKLKQSW